MKNLVIIGASSGIGEAVALYAAKQGVTVALTARRVEKLESIARHINTTTKAKAITHALDMTAEPTDIFAVLTTIQQQMGNIDCIWVNGGVMFSRELGTLTVSEDAQMLNTNVLGAVACIDAAIAQFKQQQSGGHIAVTSSVSALVPFAQSPMYAATKAAISHYCESIRPRLTKRGIALTLLHPGFIKTDMTKDFDKNVNPLLLGTVDKAAVDIFRALKNKTGDAAIPRIPWAMIATATKVLPKPLLRMMQ